MFVYVFDRLLYVRTYVYTFVILQIFDLMEARPMYTVHAHSVSVLHASIHVPVYLCMRLCACRLG